ncbi:MAG: transglutaminase domain-containing protein [Galactobacter sp.]
MSGHDVSRRRMSGRRRATAPRPTLTRDLIFSALMMAVAATTTWPLHHDLWLVVTATAGFAAAALAAVGMYVARLPWFVQVPVAVAWGLLIGVPAALPEVPGATVAGVIPTPSGLGEFLLGCLTSWVDVISLDPPLGRYGDVLLPVYLLTYLGGWAAAAGSIRGVRWPGVGAATALLVYGIVFGPRHGAHELLVGIGMVLVAVTWMQLVRQADRGVDRDHTRRLRWGSIRRAVVALVFVLACSMAAAGLSSLLPGSERTVARQAYEPFYEPDRTSSPLQAYRSWVTGETADATAATVTGASPGTMLRLAVLDDYDGVAFRVAPDRDHGFTRLPSTVQRPEGERQDVHVMVERELSPWLPLAGSLESIDITADVRDRLYYDRTRDAALVRGGVDAGLDYTLRVVPGSRAATAGLEALSPGEVSQSQLPVLPESLIAAADRATQNLDSPGEKLQAVLELLQAGYVSHADEGEVFSRSGHSAGRLDALVDEEPMVGDAEQYAAAFAILARQQGFASRVVLGFVDQDADRVLVGSELTAWVEVDDAKRGWVAVDPNPEPRPVEEQRKTEEDSVTLPRTVLPPDPPDLRDSTPPSADNSQPTTEQPREEWRDHLAGIWWWTWRVGLVLLLLTSPLWLAALIKRVRRVRRRHVDRNQGRMSGAWSELVDAVADAGHAPAPSATRSEVAAAVQPDDVPGGRGEGLLARSRRLAQRMDRAAFSPERPDRADIDEVWQETLSTAAHLRGAPARRRDRWRRRYSWRSIARWSRPRRAGRAPERRRAPE